MRTLFAIAALLLLAGAAPAATPKPVAAPKAAAQRDWSQVVTLTPDGNFRLGNPQAPVKLVEYLSFTCPHCAAFSVESKAVLKGQYVRSGSTSVEFRPVVRDLVDLGATMLARCAGTEGFVAAAERLFARQGDWLGLAIAFLERDAHRYALLEPTAQVRAAAQIGGLIGLFQELGLPQARIDACLADNAALERALKAGDAAQPKTNGTPTFYINGEMQGPAEWRDLQPILRAKGAR